VVLNLTSVGTILGYVRHKSAILARVSRVDWGCFPPLRVRKPRLSKVTVWVDELVSWARRGGGDAINTNPDDRQTDRPTETQTAVQFLCVTLTRPQLIGSVITGAAMCTIFDTGEQVFCHLGM
jgi:hypothetical protein